MPASRFEENSMKYMLLIYGNEAGMNKIEGKLD
jgi:hypothetical protein